VPYLCLVNPRYLQLIAGKPQRRDCLGALSNGFPVGDSWDMAGTVDDPSQMGQAVGGQERTKRLLCSVADGGVA